MRKKLRRWQHLLLYGVEGRDFKAGTGLSSEVEEAVSHLLERVLQEVQGILDFA
jgi:Ni,Fe-hydrogenase maturation factor